MITSARAPFRGAENFCCLVLAYHPLLPLCFQSVDRTQSQTALGLFSELGCLRFDQFFALLGDIRWDRPQLYSNPNRTDLCFRERAGPSEGALPCPCHPPSHHGGDLGLESPAA